MTKEQILRIKFVLELAWKSVMTLVLNSSTFSSAMDILRHRDTPWKLHVAIATKGVVVNVNYWKKKTAVGSCICLLSGYRRFEPSFSRRAASFNPLKKVQARTKLDLDRGQQPAVDESNNNVISRLIFALPRG